MNPLENYADRNVDPAVGYAVNVLDFAVGDERFRHLAGRNPESAIDYFVRHHKITGEDADAAREILGLALDSPEFLGSEAKGPAIQTVLYSEQRQALIDAVPARVGGVRQVMSFDYADDVEAEQREELEHVEYILAQLTAEDFAHEAKMHGWRYDSRNHGSALPAAQDPAIEPAAVNMLAHVDRREAAIRNRDAELGWQSLLSPSRLANQKKNGN